MANLTPEQLAWLKQATSQGGQFSNGNYVGQDGTFYQSNGNQGWGMDGTGAEAQTGWYGYDASQTKPGDKYTNYGMDGTDKGQGEFKDPGNGMDLLATGILTALTMGAFLPGVSGLSAAGGEAAVSAGFGGVGGGAAGGAAGGAVGAAGDGLLNGLNGSDIMSDAFVKSGGYGSGGFGGTSGGFLDSLINGVSSGAGGGSGTSSLLSTALKYGPGLLGGLMGGAGGSGDGNSSGTKQIDPRLLPYIYGDANNKGAFGYAKGLLDAPVAPNGFERFYGGR
jgi:hypothetical protein